MERRKRIAIITMFFLMIQSSSSNGMHFFTESVHSVKELWENTEGWAKGGVALVGALAGYVLLNEYRVNRLKRELAENKLVIGAVAYGGFDTSYDQILEKTGWDEETYYRKDLFQGGFCLKSYYPVTYAFLTDQMTEKMTERLFDNSSRSPGNKLREEIEILKKKIGSHGIKIKSVRVQVATLNRTLFGDDYTFLAHLPPEDLQQRPGFYAWHRKKVFAVLDSYRAYPKPSDSNFSDDETVIYRTVESDTINGEEN